MTEALSTGYLATANLSQKYQANLEGFFGKYGGAPLPPHLVGPIAEVAAAYTEAINDPAFNDELQLLLSDYVGRPSLLYFAKNLTRVCCTLQRI